MCKCNQTDGYVQAMQNAVSVEKSTGEEQAVFTIGGISYFGKREDVAKQEGICCYILTTGEEIKIEPKNKTRKAVVKNESVERLEIETKAQPKIDQKKDDKK